MAKKNRTFEVELPSGKKVEILEVRPTNYGSLIGELSESEGDVTMELITRLCHNPKFGVPDEEGNLPEGITDIDDLDLKDYFALAVEIRDKNRLEEITDMLRPSTEAGVEEDK